MPADDGYDPASGPVSFCRAGRASSEYGQCFSRTPLPPWPDPGEEQVCSIPRLAPESPYLLRVDCVDEAGNRSSPAQVVAATRPFSEFQDPSWAIEEVPYPVDALLGHGVDGAGDLVIAGVVYLWAEQGQEGLGADSHRDSLDYRLPDQGSGSWTWSVEDISGFESNAGASVMNGPATAFQFRFRIDPQGQPAFIGRFSRDPRRGVQELVYVFRTGASWESEVLTTDTGLEGYLSFAFDTNDQPAVAWCSGDSREGFGWPAASPRINGPSRSSTKPTATTCMAVWARSSSMLRATRRSRMAPDWFLAMTVVCLRGEIRSLERLGLVGRVDRVPRLHRRQAISA